MEGEIPFFSPMLQFKRISPNEQYRGYDANWGRLRQTGLLLLGSSEQQFAAFRRIPIPKNCDHTLFGPFDGHLFRVVRILCICGEATQFVRIVRPTVFAILPGIRWGFK